MHLFLDSECRADCTLGTLTCASLTLHAIELPWLGNASDKSCVPAGEYQLIRYESPTHGLTWRLHNPALNVWGLSGEPPSPMRTEVEIHNGNWADTQSLGCILIGLSAGELLNPRTGKMETAVIDSDVALERLRALIELPSEDDTLSISRSGLYTVYP